MNAIPEVIAAGELDVPRDYLCPLCEAQGVGDEADVGWVSCPLVNGAPICLGCCIDHQSVARSKIFDEHPYRDLFDNLAHDSGARAEALRAVCLEHQESIVVAELESRPSPADAARLEQLLEEIRSAMLA